MRSKIGDIADQGLPYIERAAERPAANDPLPAAWYLRWCGRQQIIGTNWAHRREILPPASDVPSTELEAGSQSRTYPLIRGRGLPVRSRINPERRYKA